MINEHFNDQVLLVNKPLGWTSFDVVNKIRYAGKFKKVGHAGTLDPLATGLLILCTGKKTKEIDQYQAQKKEYTGKLILGKTTPSFDLETEVDATYPIDQITTLEMEKVRMGMTGTINQLPPLFSAIKVNGKRAYEAARNGEEMVLKTREVNVEVFEIDTEAFPEIRFRIVCSKGTYIRSMVRDFGKSLQSGAYMSELCRTKIGDYDLIDAYEVDTLVELIKNNHANLPQA